MGLLYCALNPLCNIVHANNYQTAPPDQNLPRIVSRLLTLGYQSKICKQVFWANLQVPRSLIYCILQAFPPGNHFSVPYLPNIAAVNALGDYDIAADRLAIIDGEGA
jgi:hypothetical protein